MREVDSSSGSPLRSLGVLLVCGGVLFVVAGLIYWAMGWRAGWWVALWTAAWGVPFIGLGSAVGWVKRRGAGFVAIFCGVTGTGLLLLTRFLLGWWVHAAVSAMAILLGWSIVARKRV